MTFDRFSDFLSTLIAIMLGIVHSLQKMRLRIVDKYHDDGSATGTCVELFIPVIREDQLTEL